MTDEPWKIAHEIVPVGEVTEAVETQPGSPLDLKAHVVGAVVISCVAFGLSLAALACALIAMAGR